MESSSKGLYIGGTDFYNCPYKEGDLIECVINGAHVDEAKVHYENGSIYLCQDKRDGNECKNKLGYQYSWYICGEDNNVLDWSRGCKNTNVEVIGVKKKKKRKTAVMRKNPFKLGQLVRIIAMKNNYSHFSVGHEFTVAEFDVTGDWCREFKGNASGVEYRSLELVKDHVSDKSDIVTRAVKEDNPRILEESGKSLDYLATNLKNIGCMIDISSCTDLSCSDDNCPFDSSHSLVASTKDWMFKDRVKMYAPKDKLELMPIDGPGLIPKPIMTPIINKKEYFKEEKDLSLEELLNNVK